MQPEKKTSPKITVIIPAFNEGEVIGGVIERIRAVVNTLDPENEIIVIDDGSKDNTAQSAL